MGKTVAIALLAACLVCGAVADCTRNFLHDTDLFGGDLPGIPNGPSLYAADEKDCCKLCVDTQGCVAFTWSRDYKYCWLKNRGFDPPSRYPGLISKQVVPDECLGGYDHHYEYIGEEIHDGIPTSRKEICCTECAENKGCVAMTFYENNRRCHLLTDVDGYLRSINAVSW